MTLTCEDANSKLVDVVTVADVADEDHVGNSLLQIWERRFRQGGVRKIKMEILDGICH